MARPHPPIGIRWIGEVNITNRLMSHTVFTSLIHSPIDRVPSNDEVRRAPRSWVRTNYACRLLTNIYESAVRINRMNSLKHNTRANWPRWFFANLP
jgi:hypothetical protein